MEEVRHKFTVVWIAAVKMRGTKAKLTEEEVLGTECL